MHTLAQLDRFVGDFSEELLGTLAAGQNSHHGRIVVDVMFIRLTISLEILDNTGCGTPITTTTCSLVQGVRNVAGDIRLNWLANRNGGAARSRESMKFPQIAQSIERMP